MWITVQPVAWASQADQKQMGVPSAEGVIPGQSKLQGQTIHVPNQTVHANRDTGTPVQASYETHPVAPQESLEGARITEKGNSSSNGSITLTFSGELRPFWEENVLPGHPLHPLHHALEVFTDTSSKGLGAHSGDFTASRSWSVTESRLHINFLELKVVLLALKRFQHVVQGQIVLVATDNTTVVAYINKERGMRSGSLCALL